MNTNICIIRQTYYDRSAMLQLSLEYQAEATCSEDFETYVFVDPHPEYGIVSDYDKVITDGYNRINWSKNNGRLAWYYAVDYIFNTTNYDYVISIEDDVLISKDYLILCNQLYYDSALAKDDNILYFHIGAWEKPKGNVNKIIRSKSSNRSSMINKFKFKKYIKPYYSVLINDKIKYGIDTQLQNLLNNHNMITIAPETNRHGHIGIYGWSANHIHHNAEGQSSLFKKSLTHEQLYCLLKKNCLSGEGLRELNKNRNPTYFWDFDPNINFTKLEYKL
jgi:hypothetical protein